MAHFIPLKTGERDADKLAKIFVKEVWRLHGLPNSIVSDRDAQFTSKFWSSLMSLLDVKLRMSTAYHPQSDGQTERVNSTIEAYLRTYCNREQNDWSELLPLAEYAYNNSATTATGMSPFYANYGFNPRSNWPRRNVVGNPASKIYAHWITDIHTECRKTLEETRARMGRYHDQRRQEPPRYKTGDLVMLDGRNIKTRRPSKKLDDKLYGPFRIEKIVSPTAYRLTLPRKWKIHNTFHVALLEPYRQSARRPAIDPERVLQEQNEVEGEEYDVEEIMASSWDKADRRVKYLVKWLGYPDRKDWTEEPFENFSEGSHELLRDFHRQNPAAPKDYRLKV
jgi:hypothetical protein